MPGITCNSGRSFTKRASSCRASATPTRLAISSRRNTNSSRSFLARCAGTSSSSTTCPNGVGGRVPWAHDVSRLQTAVTYRFTAHTHLKVEYDIRTRSPRRAESSSHFRRAVHRPLLNHAHPIVDDERPPLAPCAAPRSPKRATIPCRCTKARPRCRPPRKPPSISSCSMSVCPGIDGFEVLRRLRAQRNHDARSHADRARRIERSPHRSRSSAPMITCRSRSRCRNWWRGCARSAAVLRKSRRWFCARAISLSISPITAVHRAGQPIELSSARADAAESADARTGPRLHAHGIVRARLGTRARIRHQAGGGLHRPPAQENRPAADHPNRAPHRLHHPGIR